MGTYYYGAWETEENLVHLLHATLQGSQQFGRDFVSRRSRDGCGLDLGSWKDWLVSTISNAVTIKFGDNKCTLKCNRTEQQPSSTTETTGSRGSSSLNALYGRTAKKGGPLSDDTNCRIISPRNSGPACDKPATAAVPNEFGEMCKMYPYLAEELKAVEEAHPGLFKREFGMIDVDKARKLDQKIKNQRVSQMKLERRGHEVIQQVTTALTDLVE